MARQSRSQAVGYDGEVGNLPHYDLTDMLISVSARVMEFEMFPSRSPLHTAIRLDGGRPGLTLPPYAGWLHDRIVRLSA